MRKDAIYDKIDHETIREMYRKMLDEKILESYTFPENRSSDGFYHIWIKDANAKSGRRQLKASTIEILKNKVLSFEHEKINVSRKTFKDCYKIIRDKKLKRVKDSEKKYSVQNTVEKMDSEYRRFFDKTEFEEKYVDDISKKEIESFYEDTLERIDLKKKGAASLKGILKAVFSYAYSEYLIEENVFDRCNFDQFKEMLIHDTPIGKRAHSSFEIEELLYFTRGYEEAHPSYMPAYALELQILIGARRGELPPLSFSDILEDRIWIHKEQITIHREKGKGHDSYVFVDRTKTDTDRFFPITNELRDYLNRLTKAHDMFYPNSTLLFPGSAPTGAITNNVVYKFYLRACKELGLQKEPGITRGTHSFRRNAITDVINKTGGNIFLASKLFGNSPRTAEHNYFTGVDLYEARVLLEK